MDPARMAGGTVIFIPPVGTGTNLAGQGTPGSTIQPPVTVQYPLYGCPSNPPQQTPQVGAFTKLLNVETKTLGAVQIMIGVTHICLGVLISIAHGKQNQTMAYMGSYPICGGLLFIISGSLAVHAITHPSPSLVRCNAGMNITCAVVALVGISLFIVELHVNRQEFIYEKYGTTGVSVIFIFLSALEFCITVTTAHFACRVGCCENEMAVTVTPYTVLRSTTDSTEGNPVL
ncbi:membrane-spanning 4-domains subfamily A member 8-like [Varanus komodoensis]|uniref:Membrane spanning 4-domains A12 n=1 Tax=Varanus komodoensis TaxID=61221 RepID=A0A8D2IVC2_VARKO|nr:membrane-spanning 4-domains subfamily A member 8-like [Varanus komodoensis]